MGHTHGFEPVSVHIVHVNICIYECMYVYAELYIDTGVMAFRCHNVIEMTSFDMIMALSLLSM